MLALTPAVLWRCVIYIAIGCGIALGVRSLRPSVPAENPAYDALSKALGRRMVADSVALDSAKQLLTRQQLVVGRQIVRYTTIRDTLNIRDTVQVKVFVARADSVVRSCTELSSSCERFRVRAESSLASIRLDRDRWKLATESLQPSGLSRFVQRTLPVVAFVGGVYVGSRVVR